MFGIPSTTSSGKLSPPGPKSKLLVGNLPEFYRDPLGFLLDLSETYGDLVHFKVGPQDVYLLNDPRAIYDVLVTNHANFRKSPGVALLGRFLGVGLPLTEGSLHLQRRRLLQPAFHQDFLTKYSLQISKCAQCLQEKWQDGETIDVNQEMTLLTIRIMGKSLFGTDLQNEATAISESFTEILSFASSMRFFRVATQISDWLHEEVPFSSKATEPLLKLIEKLPVQSIRRFHRAKLVIEEIVARMIQLRRVNTKECSDLLSILLAAQADGSLTEREVRDEVVTMMVVGYETAATALMWTWYLLSQNPEVQAKLHAEVDSVLGGQVPTTDHLKNLRYTKRILLESMRLYPPGWIFGRRALSNYQIHGYPIVAGSIIVISPYVTHRDRRYYSQPFQFCPERWNSDANMSSKAPTYFPFGVGPRSCMGERFAIMECMLNIATLAQSWRMSIATNQNVKPHPGITLRPNGPLNLMLHRRRSKEPLQ